MQEMQTLIYKILMLLQSLKCSSQTQPRMLWSSYWQTTYASDSVPDYWNHGSIYLPRPPQSKKVDIFSSWLARAITEPSRHVTETTPTEDYEINIYKPSTAKVFNIKKAEIETEAKAREANLEIEKSRAKSINTNSIFLRALARENNDFTHPEYETILQDIDNHPPVSTRSTPRPDTYHFTRSEYDTTIDDYEPHLTFTTTHNTVITEESDSIITENIFPTKAPRSEKYKFTRPEYDTIVYYDDANPPYSTIKLIKVTTSTDEFESNSIISDRVFTKTPRTHKMNRYTRLELKTRAYVDAHSTIKPKVTKTGSIFTTTTPNPEKYHFTRPEYDTIVYNDSDETNPAYSTTKPKATKSTKKAESNSFIVDNISNKTPGTKEEKHFTHLELETIIYDDNANLLVTKTTKESETSPLITYSINTSTASRPKKYHFTRPVYHAAYDYDEHLTSTTTHATLIKGELDSIVTDNIFTTEAPTPEKYHFTHLEYNTTVYDDYAHSTSTTMHTTVIKEKPDSIIIDNFTRPGHDLTVYDYDAHPTSTTGTTMHTTVIKEESDPIIKDNFTHPGHDVTAYNYDAHPTSTTMHPTVIKEESDSIVTDTIIFTKLPTTLKKFTRIEYGKIVYYDLGDPPVSIMNAKLMTSKQDSESTSLFTKNILATTAGDFIYPFETQIYEDDIRLMASIKGLSPTTQYEKHPNSSGMKLPTATSEYDGAIYDNHAQANSASMTQASTPDYDATVYDEKPISIMMALSQTIDYQTTQKKLSAPTTIKISSSKAEPIVRAVNQEMVSDRFSVFLKKLLIVLSVKKIEDLPVLIDQFREYLWMMLTGGQLGELGLDINSFLAKTVIVLEQFPYEELRNLSMKYQKVLANRHKELPKDINDIIDYMDDTYNKDEEQAMQAVLKEASLFPNSRHNNKIAQGLIDYVFLKPMQRLVGTTRGNVLFKMMTEALKIRKTAKDPQTNNKLRRSFNFGKTRSHLSKSLDRSSYEVTTLDKLYRRKVHSEVKSDSDINYPSENSKINKSSHDLNEQSDETENSEETKESKFYVFKENDKYGARNGRKHRAFTSANQLSTRNINIRKYFSTLKNSRYQLKSRLSDNIVIPRNALPNKYRRINTVNSARFIRTTDPSNTEMERKAKINEKFQRVNFRNYDVSRRVRYSFTSTMNIPDDTYESDVERALKSNVYKAMKKLYNTNEENFST